MLKKISKTLATDHVEKSATKKGRKPQFLDLISTLRQVKDPTIAVECITCGRRGNYVRAKLVKKHGASLTFARLRRMSALGCERLISVEGDRCGTRFPCLEKG